MPNFYSYPDTKEFGRVKVTPKPWYRRLITFFGYCVLPYVTMEKICFSLRVEKLPMRDGINTQKYCVYIELGDKTFRHLRQISTGTMQIEGVAQYTGDTKFYIAPAGYAHRNTEEYIPIEGLLLFNENVLSVNQYVWGGCILILGQKVGK